MINGWNGRRFYDEMMGTTTTTTEIKKGPWKVEEDEVLINHVKKYGPRDWSSIRSKGLLHRTGKSCRLRWVNKLRPNLKNGVKFSAEEERTVIDLQAQFGNKWAKIATYLPGRTDNDVKNFWSSRQKRLARILQTPSSSSSSNKSQKSSKHVLAIHDVPCLEGPKFSSSTEEEWLSNPQSCSSSYIDNGERFKMVPLPELMHTSSLYYEPNLLQPEFIAIEKKACIGIDQPLTQLPFPQIPLQTDFTVNFDNQEMVTGFGDPNSLAGFGQTNLPELGQMQQFPIMPTCFGTERRSSGIVVKKENDNPLTPDSFMYEFPIDMFDHIDSLPSPSGW